MSEDSDLWVSLLGFDLRVRSVAIPLLESILDGFTLLDLQVVCPTSMQQRLVSSVLINRCIFGELHFRIFSRGDIFLELDIL